MPKPAIACGTNVAENMHIITDSDAVKSCRESVLEFLLLNHPLDCPICDKAGECKLQEYANRYGAGESRYIESKNVKPKKVEVAGKIILDSERCIECSRCIRFCNEFIGKSVFGFTKRGSKTEIAVYGDDNDSNYLLNVVDGCPVGALTEKAFRFKMRTWFLKTSKSICAESSAGVNTRVWSRGDRIYRITPRRNDAVNDVFMSDSGRYVHERFRPENRLKVPRIDSSPCDLSYAVDRAVEISKLGGLAIVANGWQTLEEQFMIAALARECSAKVHMASHIAEDDGKLVSADRTPNMRGAFVTGLVSGYPAPALDALARESAPERSRRFSASAKTSNPSGLTPRTSSPPTSSTAARSKTARANPQNLHSAAQRVREGRAVDKPPVQGAEIRARGKPARRQCGRNRVAFGAYAQNR